MVSIQCLTYNHEPYIRQCLDGFVMQKTNFRFEVIVHDDASTDGTTDIVREYAIKYPDIIKPIYEVENRYSKNDGSLQRMMDEHSTGKYIAICEGDDYWTDPNKLQKQFDILETHKECSICLCKVNKVSRDGKPLGLTFPLENHIKAGIVSIEDLFIEEFSNDNWCFHTSSFFFRSDLLYKKEAGRREFFSHFHVGDLPTLLWALLHGKGFYIDEIVACYRVFSGGFTTYKIVNKELAVKNVDKWLSSYSYIDQYTNYHYHKHICRKCGFRLLEKYYAQGKTLSMLNVKFWWQYYKKPSWLIKPLLNVLPKKILSILRNLWYAYKYKKGIKDMSVDMNFSS